ncbi:hypothetical protein AB7C87_01855 [Natrarchaeobius sp. A-rgal3]|uniref:hypothetical protein n=1 Tax=Natrarchaeobius versutus TaxID=1679078 RepID=UPI00351051DA
MPNYEDYLEHFFKNTETSIREGKGQELSDNLTHISELIQELIDKEPVSEAQFRSNYNFCKRRYTRLYNHALDNGADEDLRKTIINSISAIAHFAWQSNDLEAFEELLNALTNCYVSSYPQPGFDDAMVVFFERYNTLQFGAIQNFKNVDNANELAKSRGIVDLLLRNYREIWRRSVEYECEESIKRIHSNLEDIREFEQAQYSPIAVPEDEYDQDFIEAKQDLANTFRKRIQIQKFAGYCWAYNLYVKEVYSDESFIKGILDQHAEKSFSSIESLSETYFDIQSILGEVPYWDNWETNRQLQNSLGTIVTSMGSNSWIPSFYLCFSLYLFDEDTQEKLSNTTPEELPIPVDRELRAELNNLKEQVEGFKNDYPLDFLINEEANIDKRIEKLSEVLNRAHSHAETQAIIRVREHGIDPRYIQSWQQKINDQFDNSCMLRQALKEINLLQTKRFPPDIDGVKIAAIYPHKRSFVPEEGVSKPVTSNFQIIWNKYNEYVLSRLTLEEYSVESLNELMDRLEEQVKKQSTSVILLGTGEYRRRLSDDDRLTHGGDLPGSYYSFLDTPILSEPTDTYAALLLFENESRGVEYVDEDGQALDISATPGEEIDMSDFPTKPLESVPYMQAPHDRVELDIRLRGFIQSNSLDGVLYRMPSQNLD